MDVFIGKNIKFLRKKLGLTTVQLGELVQGPDVGRYTVGCVFRRFSGSAGRFCSLCIPFP